MFDFDALQQARKQASGKEVDRDAEARQALAEAKEILGDFRRGLDKELLRDAADCLIDSLEYKPRQAEPYVYLAYVFYVMRQERKAMEYLDIAASIEPDLYLIQDFKNRMKKRQGRSLRR